MMNKPGQQAASVAASTAAANKQRALLQRADEDINNLIDNFSHLIKAARMNEPVRNAQESFQMDVHASRVVHAADSLLKLVSELKQNAVFSDVMSLNKNIEERARSFEDNNVYTDRILISVGEQMGKALRELESHYCSSLQKNAVQD